MKRKQKILAILLVTLTFFSAGMPTLAAEAPQSKSIASSEEITPRADVIEWKYRQYNGQIQARQWNATRNCWIGEWITISIS